MSRGDYHYYFGSLSLFATGRDRGWLASVSPAPGIAVSDHREWKHHLLPHRLEGPWQGGTEEGEGVVS